MSETQSITVTEELLSWEDFSYKKDTLRKHADHIGSCFENKTIRGLEYEPTFRRQFKNWTDS